MIRHGRSVCAGAAASRILFSSRPTQHASQLLVRACGSTSVTDISKWSRRLPPPPQPGLTSHSTRSTAASLYPPRRFFVTTSSMNNGNDFSEERKRRQGPDGTGIRGYRTKKGSPNPEASEERGQRPRYAATDERSYGQRNEETKERRFRQRSDDAREERRQPSRFEESDERRFRPRQESSDGSRQRPGSGALEERKYRPKHEATDERKFRQRPDAPDDRRQPLGFEERDGRIFRTRQKASDDSSQRSRSGSLEGRRFRPRAEASNETEYRDSSEDADERRYRSRTAMSRRGSMATTRNFEEEDDEEYPQQRERPARRRVQSKVRPEAEEVDEQHKGFKKPYTRRGGSFYPEDVLVVCHPGLERVLSSELKRLKIPHRPVCETTNGVIQLKPPISLETIMKCHLYLGSASHVMLTLLSGEAHHSARAMGEIVRKVKRVPWREILEFPSLNYKHKRRQIKAQRMVRKTQGADAADAGADDTPGPIIYIKLKVEATKSRIIHTGAIAERIINAINENLKEGKDWKGEKVLLYKDSDHEGKIPREPIICLEARMHYDRLRLWLNTSSLTVPLNKRGYRLAVAKAPLREDLAYAMLYNAGWVPRYDAALHSYSNKNHDDDLLSSGDESSLSSDDESSLSSSDDSEKVKVSATIPFDGFLDPFCGSGTLAIEAASMWAGLPPGRLRPPPLAGTEWHNPTLWQTMVDQAMTCARRQQKGIIKIACSDRDKGAMEAVESNAKRAGVEHLLTPWEGAFSSHKWLVSSKDNNEDRPRNLFIATNPPYGERLALNDPKGSRHEQLLPMFQTLGTRLERLGTSSSSSSYTVAILVHDKNVIKRACGGFDWENNLRFSNGNIFVTSMVTRSHDNKDEIIPFQAKTVAAEENQVETAPVRNEADEEFPEENATNFSETEAQEAGERIIV